MKLAFEYPYQWSNTGDRIKHWCFLLPIDERTTRVFFLFYFDALKFPFTPFRIPRAILLPFLRLANRFLIVPLLRQDGVVVEAEQEAFEALSGAPFIEPNPAVPMFQQLVVRRWQEHLGSQSTAAARRGGAEAVLALDPTRPDVGAPVAGRLVAAPTSTLPRRALDHLRRCSDRMAASRARWSGAR